MPDPIILTFTHPVDLAATMDIQIPALTWQPVTDGWTRTYHLTGEAVRVTVTPHPADDNALRFEVSPTPAGTGLPAVPEVAPAVVNRLAAILRTQFPRQVASLDLSGHPVLKAMHENYAGVVIMHTDPFEALVLTILSQNRTGEIVRKVFPALDLRCGGITPARLAALDERELAETIRSAGPYKAPRLAATAQRIAAEGPQEFTQAIVDDSADRAMAYLTSLPGVAHKTAACVLVFAADSNATLPVDTHLFRVAHRLGLAPHNGKLNTTTRDAIIAALLAYGPDLAPAHFLFLLLGRSTCTAEAPACSACFAQPACPTALQPLRSRP